MLFLAGANVRAVGLIMCSGCMMARRGLYLLTRSLVLIIIYRVTNVRGKFALRIFSSFGSRPAKGPGVSKSCAHIARSGAHV